MYTACATLHGACAAPPRRAKTPARRTYPERPVHPFRPRAPARGVRSATSATPHACKPHARRPRDDVKNAAHRLHRADTLNPNSCTAPVPRMRSSSIRPELLGVSAPTPSLYPVGDPWSGDRPFRGYALEQRCPRRPLAALDGASMRCLRRRRRLFGGRLHARRLRCNRASAGAAPACSMRSADTLRSP